MLLFGICVLFFIIGYGCLFVTSFVFHQGNSLRTYGLNLDISSSTHYFMNMLLDATLDTSSLILYMVLSLYGLIHYGLLSHGFTTLLLHHALLLHGSLHHGYLLLCHFIMIYFSMAYFILGIYNSVTSALFTSSSVTSSWGTTSLQLFIMVYFVMLIHQTSGVDIYCNRNHFLHGYLLHGFMDYMICPLVSSSRVLYQLYHI